MTEVFDDQAAAYDRWYASPLGQLVDRVEQAALFDLLPDLNGRRILEVGCGTGNISQALVSRGARLVGLDVSGPMLAAAQNRARQQGYAPDLVRGGAGVLPFPEESFDGVISILALDFMADRPGVVRELVRVLRPRGFLVLALLNRYSLWTLKRVVRAWCQPSLWGQVKFATARELRQLLTGHPDLTGLSASRAVYFPPWASPALLPYYPALERLGGRLHLPMGAFLVAAARKR
jgi:ubiquinone/menaquinone biosynthesis C-methylase UbiE